MFTCRYLLMFFIFLQQVCVCANNLTTSQPCKTLASLSRGTPPANMSSGRQKVSMFTKTEGEIPILTRNAVRDMTNGLILNQLVYKSLSGKSDAN